MLIKLRVFVLDAETDLTYEWRRGT